MNWDFRQRVLTAALIPAAFMSIILGWYFTATRIAELESALTERGLTMVRALAPASEFGVFAGNEDILRQLIDAARREPEVDGVAVFDAAGRRLSSAGVTLEPIALEPIALEPIATGAAAVTEFSNARLVERTGQALRFAANVGRLKTPVDILFDTTTAKTSGAAPIGTIVVQLSTRGLAERRATLIRNAALITFGGLILAGLVAGALARGVTRPVLDLAAAVGRIERGDLAVRVPANSSGALGLLEHGVNAMAASITDARATLQSRIDTATAALQAAKERAEDASRNKTQFLAAASHDLRQPLQALGLLVHSLKSQTHESTARATVDHIEIAQQGLENVVEGLLDISRLDAGTVQPRPQPFPINRVLNTIAQTFAAPAAEQGLSLRVVPSGAWVHSDPLLLERIVANFVANAVRYTASGGIVIGCRRHGDRIAIEVWDSGTGIPQAKHAEIFREFVQLGNPNRTRDKGLGLGLAIVQRLARLLDHPIGLRSRLQTGSVFWVEMPRAAPKMTITPARVETASGDLAGLTLLVIDDDLEVLGALERFLTGERAIVITAASASEARARLARASERPDLVITDFRLGQASTGLEAIDELQLTHANIPCIVVTGESDPEVLRAIAASGLAAAAKPIRPDVLKLMIQRLVGKT